MHDRPVPQTRIAKFRRGCFLDDHRERATVRTLTEGRVDEPLAIFFAKRVRQLLFSICQSKLEFDGLMYEILFDFEPIGYGAVVPRFGLPSEK